VRGEWEKDLLAFVLSSSKLERALSFAVGYHFRRSPQLAPSVLRRARSRARSRDTNRLIPTMSKSPTTTKPRRRPRAALEPIPPGEILREEFLRPLGISVTRLARDLEVPPNRISTIANGMRAITADTALRLGEYFGVSAELSACPPGCVLFVRPRAAHCRLPAASHCLSSLSFTRSSSHPLRGRPFPLPRREPFIRIAEISAEA